MKKSIYVSIMVIALSACLNISKAQITLEHTFDPWIMLPNIYEAHDINRYVLLDALSKEVRLYDTDYSLYKTIPVTPPVGYRMANAAFFTKILKVSSLNKSRSVINLIR